MAPNRIRLDPQTVDAVARRVVEILEERGLQQRELVDAGELARQLGVERSWIYTHAIELGAVKLGDGPKARLRFDLEIAARILRKVGEVPAADPPARSGERAARPRGGRGRSGRSPAFRCCRLAAKTAPVRWPRLRGRDERSGERRGDRA